MGASIGTARRAGAIGWIDTKCPRTPATERETFPFGNWSISRNRSRETPSPRNAA